nr:mechanosensitive ion channel protein 2, chloroplastic-like [Tanacetum cinerariifolium]
FRYLLRYASNRLNLLKCNCSLNPSLAFGTSSVKNDALALSSDLQGKPILLKLLPAVGIVVFAVWELKEKSHAKEAKKCNSKKKVKADCVPASAHMTAMCANHTTFMGTMNNQWLSREYTFGLDSSTAFKSYLIHLLL